MGSLHLWGRSIQEMCGDVSMGRYTPDSTVQRVSPYSQEVWRELCLVKWPPTYCKKIFVSVIT